MDGAVGNHQAKPRARRLSTTGLVGTLAAAATLLVWPGLALAHAPAPGGKPPIEGSVRGPSPMRAAAAAQTDPPAYRLADGSTVRVRVAPEFRDGPMLGRLLAGLGSLLHGREMNLLTVYIASAAELQSSCGGGGGCYFPFDQSMVVPGDDSGKAMPFEMLVAHEYGHHIERNRSTNGWPAGDLGARHWATHEHVCEGVSAGRLFPGDQSAHYWENPGEAFAQAYAFLHYPDLVPWWWSFAEPDEAAYSAIGADVADSSGAGVKGRWAKRLNAGKALARKDLSTPVDGPLRVRLTEPRSGRFDLVLVSPDGRVLRRARPKRDRASGGRVVDELRYSVCGARSMRLEVRRRSGKGRFAVKIQRP